MKRPAGALSVAGMIGAFLFAVPQAQAVWFNPVGVGAFSALGGGLGYGGFGGYGYGGFGVGGTVAGNYMQGMSQVIRAEGQYNESTARAMISYEEARSKYLDNKKKWTDTYYALREQNDARTAQRLAREKHSPEVLAAAARSRMPRLLSSEAFDPITGKIQWPDLLRGDQFTKPRTEIEKLLELHTTTGGAAASPKLQQSVSDMIEILKANIQTLPTNEYITARKFLDSLAFTVQQA